MKHTPISDCYFNCREFLKNGDKEKARDKADEGIVWLASLVSSKNLKDNDIIEGVKVSLWYDRFWLFLELNGLLLDKDDEHNPKENYFWDKMAGVEL
jgi:hypothetical protein